MEENLMLSVEDIKNMLDTSEKGWPYSTIDNATIVFKNDPVFAGNIRENLFRERIELFGTMSWSRNKREITDKDEIHILHFSELLHCHLGHIHDVAWIPTLRQW